MEGTVANGKFIPQKPLSLEDMAKILASIEKMPERDALLFMPEMDGYKGFVIPEHIAKQGLEVMDILKLREDQEKQKRDNG